MKLLSLHMHFQAMGVNLFSYSIKDEYKHSIYYIQNTERYLSIPNQEFIKTEIVIMSCAFFDIEIPKQILV